MIKEFKSYKQLATVQLNENASGSWNNIMEISTNHLFIFSEDYKDVKKDPQLLNVEFYQKKFQNFPVKFIG